MSRNRQLWFTTVCTSLVIFSIAAEADTGRLNIDPTREVKIRYSPTYWGDGVHLVKGGSALQETSGVDDDIAKLKERCDSCAVDVFYIQMSDRKNSVRRVLVRKVNRTIYSPKDRGELLVAYFVYGPGSTIRAKDSKVLNMKSVKLNSSTFKVDLAPAEGERELDVRGLALSSVEISFKPKGIRGQKKANVKVNGPVFLGGIRHGLVYYLNAAFGESESAVPSGAAITAHTVAVETQDGDTSISDSDAAAQSADSRTQDKESKVAAARILEAAKSIDSINVTLPRRERVKVALSESTIKVDVEYPDGTVRTVERAILEQELSEHRVNVTMSAAVIPWFPEISVVDASGVPVLGAEVKLKLTDAAIVFSDLGRGVYRANQTRAEENLQGDLVVSHADFSPHSQTIVVKKDSIYPASITRRIAPPPPPPPLPPPPPPPPPEAELVTFKVSGIQLRSAIVTVKEVGGGRQVLHDGLPGSGGTVSVRTTANFLKVVIEASGYAKYEKTFKRRDLNGEIQPELKSYPIKLEFYQAGEGGARKARVDGSVSLYRRLGDPDPIAMVPVEGDSSKEVWTTPEGAGITIEDQPTVHVEGGWCYGNPPDLLIDTSRLTTSELPRWRIPLAYSGPVIVVGVAADRQLVNRVSDVYRPDVRRLMEGLLSVLESQAAELNRTSSLGRFEILLIGDKGVPLDRQTLHDCDSKSSSRALTGDEKKTFAEKIVSASNPPDVPLDSALSALDDELGRLPVGQGGARLLLVSSSSRWRAPVSLENAGKMLSITILPLGAWGEGRTKSLVEDLTLPRRDPDRPALLTRTTTVNVEPWDIKEIVSDSSFLVTFSNRFTQSLPWLRP